MPWAVEDFLVQIVASLNGQGYRVDALTEARPVGKEGGAWRVAMRSPDEGMPASVIVKRANENCAWRWNDWACQFFISDLLGTRGLGPEFFAAEEALGYYMIEDLGLGQDPAQAVVLEGSRGRLAAGLLACALAGLHAGTWGRERPYQLLRERIPGQAPHREQEAQAWRQKVEAALLRLGLTPDQHQAALNSIQTEISDPGEFLTLTHGDWQASNLWYGDAGPRFLDFRNGGYRHALLDLAAWEARCFANDQSVEVLWREYKEEWARMGADRGERFLSARARAKAYLALEALAEGLPSPWVLAFLGAASQEPGLETLADIATSL